MPTQVKLAIVCCFFLAALVSFARERLQLSSFPSFVRESGVTFFKFFFQTIPDKRVGTRGKFSPPPTFNVDNQVIFALFVGKNALFSNIDYGGRGIRDTAQVYQLLLAAIVAPRLATRLSLQVLLMTFVSKEAQIRHHCRHFKQYAAVRRLFLDVLKGFCP